MAKSTPPAPQKLLEVFDAARHAQYIVCNISRLVNCFPVRTKTEDMGVEAIQSWKHYDYERVRCVESWVSGSASMNCRSSLLCLSFLFVSTGVSQRGDMRGRVWICVVAARRIGGFRYDIVYSCLYH